MSADDVTNLLIRVSYLTLAALTLVGLARHRDKARLDIALPFTALGIAVAASMITQTLHITVPALRVLNTLLLIGLPYFFLRLLKHFRPVPRILEQLTIAGLALSTLAVMVLPTPLPLAVSLFIVAYFVLAEGYTVVQFVRRARATRGVTRWQLILVAAGSGLFMLVILLAGVGVALPRLLSPGPAERTLLVLCAGAYYLGFSAPSWLRRIWQNDELRAFVQARSGVLEVEQKDHGLSYLCEFATRAVGGERAVVGVWDENRRQLILEQLTPGDDPQRWQAVPVDRDDAVGRAWNKQKPVRTTRAADFGEVCAEQAAALGTNALYVVPISLGEQKLGLLMVFVYGALFPEDDLELLALFTWQQARTLRFVSLIDDLRYQSLLLSSVSDVIISFDMDHHILSWNRAAEAVYGWKEDEVVGRTVDELLLPNRARLELRAVRMEAMRQGGTFHGEVTHTTKDGHVVHVLVSASLVRDGDGEAIGSIMVGRDITERKRGEELIRELNASLTEHAAQLAKSEEKFAKAFQASPAGMSITRLSDGILIEVNEAFARMSGYRREELIGHTALDLGLFDPAERNRMMEAIRRDGHIRDVEMQLCSRTNQIVDLLISAEEIELLGEPCGLTIHFDITQRKLAEAEIRRLNADLGNRQSQLEEAYKELESFSYTVSHDLRAPLRVLDGYSQVVLEDYSQRLPEDGAHYLTRIRENSQKMGQLIDDLLQFSRLSRQSVTKQRVSMRTLVEQAIEAMRDLQDGRKIEIKVGELPDAQGDPALLTQVVVNLLSNALKYTRRCEVARIEIGAQKQDGSLVYFVRDNGVGFEMQYVDKLFGVFQRLHRAEDYEGTGVGLATVQRIITRHGGRIWAEAEPEKGATFYFTLEGDSNGSEKC